MQKRFLSCMFLVLSLFVLSVFPVTAATVLESNTAAWLNGYRSSCGLNPLLIDSRLSASAKAHSIYITTNFFDESAFNPSYHYEVSGKPSFYGVALSDRAARAGYNGEYLSEVIMMYWNVDYENTFYRDAIDGWIDSIYHRFGVLNPNLENMGAGENYTASKYAFTLDFGTKDYQNIKKAVAYPPDNALGIPLLFEGNETPEPLPGADYPVGYPVTMTFWGNDFVLENASVKDPSGYALDSYILSPEHSDYMLGSVAVVPKNVLFEASIYTASVKGTLDGKPYNRTWSFTTHNYHTEFFNDPYRLAGFSRYSTSARISSSGWKSSRYVVIANGLNFPDALAGIPLASAYGAPLLLCAGDSIPQVVLDEINRLDASEAFVLGGETAVSPKAVTLLTSKTGIRKIARLGGSDRYETAALIAQELKDKLGKIPDNKAVIVSGENFPDALSASAYAGFKKYPILPVRRDSVPSATSFALSSLEIDKALIVGGPAVVSDPVAALLPSAARVAGIDRYETSARMADLAAASGLSYGGLLLASGASFPDALAGGALASKNGDILLLTYPSGLDNPYSTGEDAKTALSRHASEVHDFELLGGPAAVRESVKYELLDLVK